MKIESLINHAISGIKVKFVYFNKPDPHDLTLFSPDTRQFVENRMKLDGQDGIIKQIEFDEFELFASSIVVDFNGKIEYVNASDLEIYE